MLQTLRNAWKVPELKTKLIFTMIIIVLYRLGSQIPVPFVSSDALNFYMSAYANGSIFQYLNILSGDAFAKATLFALAVSPYITASIVIQLLTVAIPALEKMAKDGEDGKKKINKITRYLTVGLALVTAYGYYAYMKDTVGAVTEYGSAFFGGLTIVLCYVAGASIIMWLAEKIDEHGIGNGISMILFANIISTGFTTAQTLLNQIKEGGWQILFAVLTVIIGLAIITFVVFFTNSERRIPVQYAKRVVGRKMYGGQSTNLPIKLNMSGVMPIIFASSIVSLPATIITLAGKSDAESGVWYWLNELFAPTSLLYLVAFLGLIIAFSYFYILISFDPVEVSNNLKANGGSVPGIRPGAPTAEYIKKILGRITFLGAIFLVIIAGVPLLVSCIASLLGKFTVTTEFFGAGVLNGLTQLNFGGSSLLIVIGVALETYRIIEAQMSMRHYKGFLQ